MKNTRPALPSAYLDALAEAFFPANSGSGPAAQAFFIPKLAVFTAAVGVHLIAYAGAGLVRRIHNHFDPPPPPAPPRPSPSLRGTPAPEDIRGLWETQPRNLSARLRIGSRLADLEPTLDNTFVFKTTGKTHHRIVARNPGLKGWLRGNAPEITYSTAMHYKKLATRLRQLIGLSPRIPLEWLLPGDTEGAAPLAALSAPDRTAAATARRKLLALLADNPKYTGLVRTVEQKLGLMHLSTIRRIQPPKAVGGRRRREGRKQRELQAFSLVSGISRAAPGVPDSAGPRTVSHGGRAVTLDPARASEFWDAVRRILGETAPDPATYRLQRDIRDWLSAPLPARWNRRR